MKLQQLRYLREVVRRGLNVSEAAANTAIATATVASTTRRTVVDNGHVTLGERAGVYHAPITSP